MNTDSILGGCIVKLIPGIEATTGACGHGLSIAIGMALSLKLKKINKKVFAILGDGEHGEGAVWEAALSAKKNKLDNLIIIVDYNKNQCSGTIKDVTNLESLSDKWKSFGMKVHEVNGHDVSELKKILSRLPINKKKPTALICHTVKGKGFSFAENNNAWHHAPLSSSQYEAALEELKN